MRKWPHSAALVLILTIAPAAVWAQAGVLFVGRSNEPQPDVLGLADMDVEVHIDHLHATVRVTQVFENRTGRTLRGRYELALGRGAAVSSFAVWEGERRQAAVVVERQRGRRIFEELTRRNLDPGLLETADEGSRSNVYTVRVDPIRPFQRVRIEVGYSQELELAADEALFLFPLAGREHIRQQVDRLRVRLNVEGPWPIEGVELRPESGFRVESLPAGETRTGLRAVLDQQNVTLGEDLLLSMQLGRRSGVSMSPVLLAYRRPLGAAGRIDRTAFGGRRYTDDRGYFVFRSPIQAGRPEDLQRGPQDVVVALDTSLSMRGDKLERAVAAVEGLLSKLRPRDRFALLTFNDEVRHFSGGLGAPSAKRRSEAREFFRSGHLSGGTDLLRAVPAALKVLSGSSTQRRTVVLITDGQPSLGSLESTAIARAAASANEELGASGGRLFVLGVGDDANHLLLENLAQTSEGLYAHAGEGADITPVLRRFLYRLDAPAVEDLRLDVEGGEGVEDLYPAKAGRVFDGSAHVVFGRYRTPAKRARFRLRGRLGSRQLESVLEGPLPRRESSRSWIARGWAQRRVADLLARIDADGERDEWVQEIVALAREHLLVTPYTSLIAAARSLLRPREIQPGDPVLRVRTDSSDRSVTAIFPFGLVKELRPIEPGLFETRFLAPTHMADGRHEVDLVVTGSDGRRRVVRDHFVIDSEAPRPRILPIENGPARAGDRVPLVVRSDRDTRRLYAYLRTPGLDRAESPPARLQWSAEAQGCVGELIVNPSLPTGTYELVVIAEDRAHNVGSASMPFEVRGR